MILSISVALAVLAVSPAFADLGKKSLFPNGLHDPLIKLDNLPVPTYTYKSVAVPDLCKSHASDAGCNVTAVQAFQVTYNDCSEPWTLCRCPAAQMGYVGSALAAPASSCSAGSGGDFIVFNGNCSQSVFDHESGHSLDQGTSPSQAWATALSGSSCVPDDYADTSTAEDFAQVNVCYTYKTRVGALPVNTTCMQPQLAVFANNARIHSAHTATKCNANARPFQLTSSAASSASLENARYTGKIETAFFHENL